MIARQQKYFVFFFSLAMLTGPVWGQEAKIRSSQAMKAEQQVKAVIKAIQKDFAAIRANIMELKRANMEYKKTNVKIKPILKSEKLQRVRPIDQKQLEVKRKALALEKTALEKSKSLVKRVNLKTTALEKDVKKLEKDFQNLKSYLSQWDVERSSDVGNSLRDIADDALEIADTETIEISGSFVEMGEDPCSVSSEASCGEKHSACLDCCDLHYPMPEVTAEEDTLEYQIQQLEKEMQAVRLRRCITSCNFEAANCRANEYINLLSEIAKLLSGFGIGL